MSPLQSLQAHVRFIMEVKNIARHIAEIVLFNWIDQIHELLLQYRRRQRNYKSCYVDGVDMSFFKIHSF